MGHTPDGWEPGERTYPYWDDNIESLVYGHYGPDQDWMVSVSPMLVNDRVLLSRRAQYPTQWAAGFCYDKGPAAGLAAAIWDPTSTPEPDGHKRVAGDDRTLDELPTQSTTTEGVTL